MEQQSDYYNTKLKGLPIRGDVSSLYQWHKENLPEKQFKERLEDYALSQFDREHNKPKFFIVPVNLLKRADLTDTEKLVGALLLSYEGEFGAAPSQKTMAQDLGKKDVQAIARAIKGLAKKVGLRYGRSHTRYTYKYDLTALKDCDQGPEREEKPKRVCRNGLAGKSKPGPHRQPSSHA
jgi:hypothetical protein